MSDSRRPHSSRDNPWRPWRMEELGTPTGTPTGAPTGTSGGTTLGGTPLGGTPLNGKTVAKDKAPSAEERERQHAFQRQSELAKLRQQVREEARREGYQAGLIEGREVGHAEGLEQGRQAGAEESARRSQALLAPLVGLAGQFQAALTTLESELADELVDLALATGRQLAGEALKARPHQILAVIRQLLREEALLNGQPRLWLHPRDLALVEEQELAEELHAAGWTLGADDQLQRGGCRVTSITGELDASGESRWQAVLERQRKRPRGGKRRADTQRSEP